MSTLAEIDSMAPLLVELLAAATETGEQAGALADASASREVL